MKRLCCPHGHGEAAAEECAGGVKGQMKGSLVALLDDGSAEQGGYVRLDIV